MVYRFELPPPDDLAWLSDALAWRGNAVASLMPTTATTVLRLRHPAYRLDGDGRPVQLSWAEAVPDRMVAEDCQFSDLVGDLDYENGPSVEGALWQIGPTKGTLPRDLAIAVASALPTTTQWRFGIWAGWASVSPHADPSSLLTARDRSYFMLSGSAEDVGTSLSPTDWRAPNLWWDDTRSWFLHTEIDRADTFIAASAETRDRLISRLPTHEWTEVSPQAALYPLTAI